MESSSRSALAWPFAAVLAVVGLAAFIVVMALSGDLFVFSEARTVLLRPPTEHDLLRFFVLPVPDWGHGRLASISWFEINGAICGVDHRCVNVAGAFLVAAGAVLAVFHARQIIGSLGVAVWVGLLWLLSPAVLALTMWQSTRYDSLAFVLALASMSLWWWALGRSWTSTLGGLAFVVGSVLLLALSFNAKEATYFLPGVLLLSALVRGYGIRAVRRNLVLAAVPLLYATYFIGYGLSHLTAGYAANSSLAYVP
jgi:hypothetical protein